jgi:hypothetical protein
MATFSTDFLQIRSKNTVNFIRFSSISALEINDKELSISLSIQDQKENFIIRCKNFDVFKGYIEILNKVLKLDFEIPQEEEQDQSE